MPSKIQANRINWNRFDLAVQSIFEHTKCNLVRAIDLVEFVARIN